MSETKSSLPLRGECNCGAVVFELANEPRDIYICHCSLCRRSTGGQGIAVSLINKAAYTWIEGEVNIRSWSKPGHEWQTSFCVTCGSPTPGENDDNNLFIPVSLLNRDIKDLRVAHHLFVDSKADWEVIGDSAKQHPDNFEE